MNRDSMRLHAAQASTPPIELVVFQGPAKKKRKRKWAPKVRTGCITCRARRVKCDETRPGCRRCEAWGKKCEGYGTVNAITLQSPSPSSSSSPSSSALSLTPQPDIPVGPPGLRPSRHAKFMFELMRRRTADQVAGTFDHSFWNMDVLRAAHVYPAIWHATLALAAMNHAVMSAPGPARSPSQITESQDYAFAVDQYSRGINHIISITQQKQLSYANKETLLLASLLFAAVCSLQGEHSQAIMHGHNGLRLFQQWQFWQETQKTPAARIGGLLNPGSLATLLSGTELQLLNRFPKLGIPCRTGPAAPPTCSEKPFTCATEAYFELQPLITGFLGLWQYTAPTTRRNWTRPVVDLGRRYAVEFASWRRKFDAFVDKQADKETADILTLQLWAKAQESLVQADLSRGQVALDVLLDAYKESADVAERLCERLTHMTGGSTEPQFQISLSICELLFWTGHGCRDGPTRRRYLSLMQRWPIYDGIWDTRLLAEILEKSIHQEENSWREGGCACVEGVFICNEHRVVGHEVEFLAAREAKVAFFTVGDRAAKRNGRVATVTW